MKSLQDSELCFNLLLTVSLLFPQLNISMGNNMETKVVCVILLCLPMDQPTT